MEGSTRIDYDFDPAVTQLCAVIQGEESIQRARQAEETADLLILAVYSVRRELPFPLHLTFPTTYGITVEGFRSDGALSDCTI